MAPWDFLKKKKNPEDQTNDLEAVVSPKPEKGWLDHILPEDPAKREAFADALMMASANMMIAGGPSATPTNFMQALGQGLVGGNKAYQDSMENAADNAYKNAAVSANNLKMQQSAMGTNLQEEFFKKWGPPGPGGYPPEALYDLQKMQLRVGDEESARATQKQIQELQQTGAGKGMVIGENGFQLAPGFDQALYDTKKAESLGSSVGQNTQTTNDQKNFEFGLENPAFRTYENQQNRSKAANVNVSTGPKEGKIFEEMTKERENAAQSARGLKLVYEMKQALPNAITGFGAEYLLAGQKAIAALGGDASKVVDTESLQTQAMELAASMKGDLVGNQQISNSDMMFVQAVAAGDIKLDGGTIKRLVDLREVQLKGNVNRYNTRVDSIYPDTPENQTNRSYLGGIELPENPYTDQGATSSVGQTTPKTNRASTGTAPEAVRWEYFTGPDGKKYKRAVK